MDDATKKPRGNYDAIRDATIKRYQTRADALWKQIGPKYAEYENCLKALERLRAEGHDQTGESA